MKGCAAITACVSTASELKNRLYAPIAHCSAAPGLWLGTAAVIEGRRPSQWFKGSTSDFIAIARGTNAFLKTRESPDISDPTGRWSRRRTEG